MRAKFGAILVVVMLVFLYLVVADTPVWVGSNINYSVVEDLGHYHDLRTNISQCGVTCSEITFAIDTETNITWTNSTGTRNASYAEISSWIYFVNASIGNLTYAPLYDNQTGYFTIPIQATNTTSSDASVTVFEYILNATNDIPIITDLGSEYNLTETQNFYQVVNAGDEEIHLPLVFNLSWIDNCTHASWTGRSAGENCSIFNITQLNSTSAYMNITPNGDEVGTYWAWIATIDSGERYNCSMGYCDNSTYKQNQTSSIYLVKLNIRSTLSVNVTNCTNMTLMEGNSFSCQIVIRTSLDKNYSVLQVSTNRHQIYSKLFASILPPSQPEEK